MATVITPPTVRVSFEQTFTDINVANVFWLSVSPDVSEPVDLADFSSSLSAAYQAHILPLQTSELSLVSVKSLYYGPAGEFSGESVGTHAGGNSESPLPQDSALVASWQIARTYRGGHPRSYFAGLCYTDIYDTTKWQPSRITVWQAALAAFNTAVNAISSADFSSVTLGTQSRSTGGFPRTDSLFERYLGVSVQPRICSQRRRLGSLL